MTIETKMVSALGVLSKTNIALETKKDCFGNKKDKSLSDLLHFFTVTQ
jgi:hypothetical protein